MKKTVLFHFIILFLFAGKVSYSQQRDITLIMASDLHFDSAPETDQFYHILTMNKLPHTYVWAKDAPKSFVGETLTKVDGVVISGDTFDNPCPESIKAYKRRYEIGTGEKQIHYNVYPGFGNHDVHPGQKGDVDNLSGRAYSLKFLDSTLQAKLSKKEILNIHPSSRAYSWNIGDVHFVQMHTYAGDTTYCESNMKWLKEDLKKYASKGNPVVVVQHYGFDDWAAKWWPEKVRSQLFDLLDQYNLAGFFVGHTHEASVQTYKGHNIYQINNAWPDEDGNGSFAVLKIKGNDVGIATCRWIDDKGNYEIIAPKLNSTLKK